MPFGDAVKQAIVAALRSRKPIVLERLEFAEKKSALENEGRGRVRMLSCFAYRRVIQHLRAAAFRVGVEVLPVHPAYTSTIGAVNYAARFGISIHQGAAIAIARRGLGLSERPAVRVAQLSTRQGGHVTFPLPEWNQGQHVWSFWSKVSRQMRAALTAPVQSRNGGKYTRVSEFPDAVCNLSSAWCDPARQSSPTLFGKRDGIKCHFSGTA